MKSIQHFVKQAMLNNGINPPEEIIADGEIHRFGNDKGKDPCWYVAHDDGIPSAAFGDWRTGLKIKIVCKAENDCVKLTEAERRDELIKVQQRIRQRKINKELKNNKAISKATWVWGKTLPVTHHDYLVEKKIKPHSARLYKGALVIPAWNSKNTLVSLQYIRSSDNKRFAYGSKTTGVYHQFGKYDPNKPALIAEGWATGASLYEKFGYPTYVAFSATNLKHVAQYVRSIHMGNEIIIMGDNDANGVGQKYANEAAKLINASCLIPPTEGFDWNDQINHDNEIGAGL
jgi:putative DNA primase/helicase